MIRFKKVIHDGNKYNTRAISSHTVLINNMLKKYSTISYKFLLLRIHQENIFTTCIHVKKSNNKMLYKCYKRGGKDIPEKHFNNIHTTSTNK